MTSFFTREQKELAYNLSFNQLVTKYKQSSNLLKVLSKDYDFKDVDKNLNTFLRDVSEDKRNYENAMLYRKTKEFKERYEVNKRKHPLWD